jgi:beta-barrel assembly-enhancing protease
MLELTKNFIQTHSQKTATVLAAICAFAWVPNLVLPVSAQVPSSLPKTPIGQKEPIVEELTIYEQAAAELPEDYYILYRIVERMARINNLADLPWRVGISSVEENAGDCINAFASQANLVYLCKGLMDRVAGDVSALACVVGHEMAHHQLHHIPTGYAEWTQGIEEIEKIEDEEDREKRMEEFIQHIYEVNRSQELEADAFGYQYAIAAGFEPEGCLRILNVLSRLPGSLLERSHPAVPDRIVAIQNLISGQSSQAVKNISYQQLDETEPLTYEWLEAEEKLRIDSKRGGSFLEDLESLLGQTSE